MKKRMIALLVGLIAAMTMVSVSMANPLSIKEGAAKNGKLTLIGSSRSDAKTILIDDDSIGLETYLTRQQVTRADVYQLLFKEDYMYRYGLVGDVQLGLGGLTQLGLVPSSINAADYEKIQWNSDVMVQNMVKEVASFVEDHPLEYTMIHPFVYDKKNKTYDGTILVAKVKDGVSYKETVHLRFYNNRVDGPSVRFALFSAVDDGLLWPMIATVWNAR